MKTAQPGRKVFSVNQLIPLASVLVAGLFIWLGLTKYGFWHDQQGPMAGFYPTVIGFGLLAMAILGFFFSFKDEAPVFPKESWMAVLGGLSIIGATFLIGLIPSAGLYVIVWLKAYEKFSWKTTLVSFAVIMAIVVGCFVLWLQVPFPRGMLFDAILK